jgi:hypothetical protein
VVWKTVEIGVPFTSCICTLMFTNLFILILTTFSNDVKLESVT